MVGETTFVERWVTNPRSLIAYSLLLGAVAGTSMWIQHAVRGGALTWSSTLAAIAYYTVAGYAGIQLLRRGPSAEAWGLGALIPQVLQLKLGPAAYKVVCGPEVTVAIDAVGIGFHAGVGSVVEVGVASASLPTEIVLNLFAVAFASYLYHQRSRLTSA
jgi:hypothetical protein